MNVRIEHELQLFRAGAVDFEPRRTLPPGRYQVEVFQRANGERWWKLRGEDWGNAVECWQAVGPHIATTRQRLEAFSRKTALVLAALVWSCLWIQTDWVTVKTEPGLAAPGHVAAALAQQCLQGAVYAVRAEPDGSFVVARYAAGWRLLAETISGHGRAFVFFHRHLAQVHKELLLLLMGMSVLFPYRQVIGVSLKFLVPLLLVPLLGAPVVDPLLDRPLVFYYLGLAAAVAALVWNMPEPEVRLADSSNGRVPLSTWVAAFYTGLVLTLLVMLKL